LNFLKNLTATIPCLNCKCRECFVGYREKMPKNFNIPGPLAEMKLGWLSIAGSDLPSKDFPEPETPWRRIPTNGLNMIIKYVMIKRWND